MQVYYILCVFRKLINLNINLLIKSLKIHNFKEFKDKTFLFLKLLHLITNNYYRSNIAHNKSYASNVTFKINIFMGLEKNTIYCPDFGEGNENM